MFDLSSVASCWLLCLKYLSTDKLIILYVKLKKINLIDPHIPCVKSTDDIVKLCNQTKFTPTSRTTVILINTKIAAIY